MFLAFVWDLIVLLDIFEITVLACVRGFVIGATFDSVMHIVEAN